MKSLFMIMSVLLSFVILSACTMAHQDDDDTDQIQTIDDY